MKLADLYSKFEKSRESNGIGRSKMEWLKMPKKKKEKIVIRLIPYSDEQDIGEIKYFHFNINGNKYECIKEEKGSCPICNVLQKHELNNIKRFLRSGTLYCNVQIPSKPDKVYALSISEYFIKWCNETASATGITDLFDPVTGRDIIMWRKSDKGAFERQIAPLVRPIADTPEKVKALIAKALDFSKYFKPLSDDSVSLIQNAANLLDKDLYLLEHPAETQEDDIPDFPAPIASPSNQLPCFGKFKGVDNIECISCGALSECMSKTTP